MLYLSPIWSSCSKELLERVLRMQKRAAQIKLDTERTTRKFIFHALNWIPTFIEAYISKCFIAYMRLEGITPDHINSILKTTFQIHNISIRFWNPYFHCPVFKKNTVRGRTFSVKRILKWNKLSADDKKVKNFDFFETNFIVYEFNH